jgi:2-polyprenyl-3-methyl-5-hydroxy-6-metoxy-1,4-benzoquinol methylase
MTVRADPEGKETDALFDVVDLAGREVLEIGCGDGRLTRRYAERTAHVVAIDPFGPSIERAGVRTPSSLKDRVEYRHVGFEDFAARTDGSTFDVAILSWSLC